MKIKLTAAEMIVIMIVFGEWEFPKEFDKALAKIDAENVEGIKEDAPDFEIEVSTDEIDQVIAILNQASVDEKTFGKEALEKIATLASDIEKKLKPETTKTEEPADENQEEVKEKPE